MGAKHAVRQDTRISCGLQTEQPPTTEINTTLWISFILNICAFKPSLTDAVCHRLPAHSADLENASIQNPSSIHPSVGPILSHRSQAPLTPVGAVCLFSSSIVDRVLQLTQELQCESLKQQLTLTQRGSVFILAGMLSLIKINFHYHHRSRLSEANQALHDHVRTNLKS